MSSPVAAYSVIESHFVSQGLQCAGTLYLPEGIERSPVVILGHGFAALRAFRLQAFAARFAEAGFAAYCFDYRNFGDSQGKPRHWVSPARHRQDWRAALEHVQALPGIDPSRTVLWGSSFGGAHVLQLAAQECRIAAVIAQVPHVSGPATLAMFKPADVLSATVAGLRDVLGSFLFNKPHYSPVVARPGKFAAMNSAECWDGWFAMVPPHASWPNHMLSRVFLSLPFYSPIRTVHKIGVPTLVIAGARDGVTPAAAAKKAAGKIRQGEFHLLQCDHFQVYGGEHFEQNMALQLAFLRRHLQP